MDETLAYDAFLHSGRIQDYLTYIGVKQEAGELLSVYAPPTGENRSEYHDRRDSAAGARG